MFTKNTNIIHIFWRTYFRNFFKIFKIFENIKDV